MNVGYSRDTSSAALVGMWAATVLGSWMLVVVVVAGIWWLVT